MSVRQDCSECSEETTSWTVPYVGDRDLGNVKTSYAGKFRIDLSGFTHERAYAAGYLRNTPGWATVKVSQSRVIDSREYKKSFMINQHNFS